MVSIREVVQTLIHLLSEKGPIAQENTWSQEHLYRILLRFRARILSEKIRQRGYSLSQYNYQTLPCVKIDTLDAAEDEFLPFSTSTVQRTLYPIPTPILIKSITSVAGNINYDFIEWERFEDIKNSRFKAERKRAYYSIKNTGEGSHIYLYNDENKEVLSITAIFEDPLLVYNFPDCNNNKKECFTPLDQEFILDPDLLPIVYELAVKSLIQPKPTDILDNKIDDITTTQIPIK